MGVGEVGWKKNIKLTSASAELELDLSLSINLIQNQIKKRQPCIQLKFSKVCCCGFYHACFCTPVDLKDGKIKLLCKYQTDIWFMLKKIFRSKSFSNTRKCGKKKNKEKVSELIDIVRSAK